MRQRDTDFYVETLAGENHGTHEGVSIINYISAYLVRHFLI